MWSGNIFGGLGTITNPIEVSCVPQQAEIPTCVAVGDFFTNPAFATQLVSTGGSNGFSPVASSNPKGDSWSVLDDAISCIAPENCVAVGEAQRPGFKAFAERYLHGKWTMMKAVTGASSALIGVACPAQSFCLAAGMIGSKSLIEKWNGTRWIRQQVPATAKPFTVNALNHVSCVTSKFCTAVGYRPNPASRFSYHTLALGWNGTSWTIQKTLDE